MPHGCRPIVIALLFALTAAMSVGPRSAHAADDAKPPTPEELQAMRERYQQLLDKRQKLDDTVWKDEQDAQHHELAFVQLWDTLRASKDQIGVLAAFPFDSIKVGDPAGEKPLFGDVTTAMLDGNARSLDRKGWAALAERVRAADIEIVQTEWHHAKFVPATDSATARSTFNITIHARKTDDSARWQIKGQIHVVWSGEEDEKRRPIAKTIDTTGLHVDTRLTAPPFKFEDIGKIEVDSVHDDVMVYDLNGDGLSEIIYAPQNTIFWNRGGHFIREDLCEEPTKIVVETVLREAPSTTRCSSTRATAGPCSVDRRASSPMRSRFTWRSHLVSRWVISTATATWTSSPRSSSPPMSAARSPSRTGMRTTATPLTCFATRATAISRT